MILTNKFFSKEEKADMLLFFRQYSPSGSEKKIGELVKQHLTALNIVFNQDDNGNIFSFANKGRPLLSAHMDQVSSDADGGFFAAFINVMPYGEDEIVKGVGNIGGDDKCGIILALMALQDDPTLNFVFSVEEEAGGLKGIKHIDFKKLKEDGVLDIPYSIVLDRRHNGDIICSQNDYGTKEFEDALSLIGKQYGYKPERGSCSDANTISDYICCANLSVAYFNPHSKNEFVSLMGLANTREYMRAILKEFEGKTFDVPKKYTPPATTSFYGNGGGAYTGVSSYGGGYSADTHWCYQCKRYVHKEDYDFTKRMCQFCTGKQEKTGIIV